MATPTRLKCVNRDTHVVTRSTRRLLEENARDNGVLDNRYQTKGSISPISNDLSNNTSVVTRSRSRNIQSFAGEYENDDCTQRKRNIRRKKNTLIIPDLSKCSTIPPRNEEHVPEELKNEAVECPLPQPFFKKSQDVTCVEEVETGKSRHSSEIQPSTTVINQNCQNETVRQELPSSTTVQNDLNSETSTKGENAIKYACRHSTGISRGQNETARQELPSSTTVENDFKSETSSTGEDANKHVVVTPYKHSRSTAKVKSATKLPNFANIHKKQFDKMESVIEWKERKQIRSTRMLMSPTPKVKQLQLDNNNTFCFKIPQPSPLAENVFKFTAMQKSSTENEGAQGLNIKKKELNLDQMTKFRSKQNFITAQAKESIIKKLPRVSREQKRDQERTYLKGVRLNKRFHLQMEMRKLR